MSVAHVYVHAPFCARRCPYCDFAVHVRRQGGFGEWIESIRRELALRGEIDLSPRLRTLYVGGGTPSLLGPGAMAALRDTLGPGRLVHGDLEWTAEANPESFTGELARDWVRTGVNRVSLGVQTFHGPSLRWMGRLHGSEGAREAFLEARDAGITNLSLDLIFGLPSRLERDLDDDLDQALRLEPDHLSIYGLSVEAGTPLDRWVREGRESSVDEDLYAEEYLRLSQRLSEEGYEHYEVSNFARPGMRSDHNQAYWNGAGYVGLGNGSHSFLPPVRSWNVRSWETYGNRLERGESPEDGRETVAGGEAAMEAIWLSLRTDTGLQLPPSPGPGWDLARAWISKGLAEAIPGGIRLTPRGWLLLDALSVEMSETWGDSGSDR